MVALRYKASARLRACRPNGSHRQRSPVRWPNSIAPTIGWSIPRAQESPPIGDAAAASDPVYASGASLTLLDVRLLRDCLSATGDWKVTAGRYAALHDQNYGSVHRLIRWQRELYWTPSPAADARRASTRSGCLATHFRDLLTSRAFGFDFDSYGPAWDTLASVTTAHFPAERQQEAKAALAMAPAAAAPCG